MRVLQINSVCGVGSTGRIATDLYKVLEKQGHECLIAYGRGTAPEGINSYKIGTNLDNYIHVARTRLLDQHGYASKKSTIELVKKIKKYNPDIIHLHNLHGYYLNLEVLFNYLAESNKPVVWTLHDCWSFTGHCSHFEYIQCGQWRTQCEKCPQIREYPKSYMIDQARENYKYKKNLFTKLKNLTIITPSEWLYNLVKDSFLGSYPIQVINNGIDLDIFSKSFTNFREIHKLENKIVLLGVASNWGERKGLDSFIQLSKELDFKYQIVLIGLNKKQVKLLPDNIIKINRTNSVQELVEIYSAADLFINPTLEDNFPTVNIEAMACELPIIAYNTGGNKEIIDHTCGVVVDVNTSEELYKAILNSSNLMKEEVKIMCRERVLKLYNKFDKFEEYIAEYKRSINI